MNNLSISFLATVFAELLTLPICTVKTIYQTDLSYKSIFDVYRDVYRKRGIGGFYNSSGMALLSQTVSTSTKYTSYMYLQRIRGIQGNDLLNNMINGGLSGIVSSIFTHPIDVVKIHKQTNVPLWPILRADGWRLIYRGYSKSLCKNIVLTSIIFPFYDFYKSKVNNAAFAAASSSIMTTAILHPIDYLKIRHITGQSLYLKNAPFWKNIRYYYRGYCVNLSRTMPHFMITMGIIDYMKTRHNLS